MQGCEGDHDDGGRVHGHGRGRPAHAGAAEAHERGDLGKQCPTQTLQRQAEKEKVGEVRVSEERVKRQEKFEERVRAAKEEMVETTQQAEEL